MSFLFINFLVVDGSYCKNEKGNFQAGYAITAQYGVLERVNLALAKTTQQAEIDTLTRACQLSGQIVNMYTDNWNVFGIAHHVIE